MCPAMASLVAASTLLSAATTTTSAITTRTRIILRPGYGPSPFLSGCISKLPLHIRPQVHPSLPKLSQRSFIWNQSNIQPKKPTQGTSSKLELENMEVPLKKTHQANSVYWLLLLNLGIFIADKFLIKSIPGLYLHHNYPQWYQFITSTFCHLSWNHLSSNLFFLYIFGKLVEEEEGGWALWISYIVTGVGANLVSWLTLPRTSISAGASGAVFGLFAVSVLVKISWDWRKILEVVILGQFVFEKVMEAAQASAQMSGNFYGRSTVNHVAHLSGALVGAAFIWLLSRIPSKEHANEKPNKKSPSQK